MKILFLTPYPLEEAPSQRFRFEQYFRVLENNGISWDAQSFFTSAGRKHFAIGGGRLQKPFVLIEGFIKRLLVLFRVPQFDFVFIHREAAPIGPPFFEWIISRILRKRIIYDFDDAIWLTDNTKELTWQKIIRWRSKVSAICRWSYKVSCGNSYLQNYAKQFNSNSILNPTTIDTEYLHNPALYPKPEEFDGVTIGWTGSSSTLKYLEAAEPLLQSLESNNPKIRYIIIADQVPKLKLQNLIFSKWSKENEVRDLIKVDIGIMPLPNDAWAQGKCGFKALQYMALGIPTIASPVGVNTKIIDHKKNGFLCTTEEEWRQALQELILSVDLRKQIGAAGKQTIETRYSVNSNSSNFLSLFE